MSRWWLAAVVSLAAGTLPAQDAATSIPVGLPPRVHTALDSASLYAALLNVPAGRAEKRAARVFRITFDSAGQPQPVVAAVPRAMPPEYRDAVTPLIQSALRPIFPRPAGWRMLLLVEAGNAPVIEEVHLPERRPELANMRVLERALYQAAQDILGIDTALVGRNLRVRISMEVDETGAVASSGIDVSSGNPLVDDAALRTVRIARFRPALLDEEPVSARVILPLHFVFPADG